MKRMIAMSVIFGLFCSVATAQQRRGQQSSQRPGQGFQQRGNGGRGGGGPGTPGSAALERAGVKLGQQLPDLTIFNDKGGKFRLADMKGKHTVIVFGCLT